MSDFTFETLQEHADSLVWRRAEGTLPPMDAENWCVGFAAGWNSLARIIGRELDPEREVETKPYYDRIRIVECPDGHETYEWASEGEKVIGAMTCACGYVKACKRHTAQEHHEKHRTSEAWKVLKADKPAPTEMQQGVG